MSMLKQLVAEHTLDLQTLKGPADKRLPAPEARKMAVAYAVGCLGRGIRKACDLVGL